MLQGLRLGTSLGLPQISPLGNTVIVALVLRHPALSTLVCAVLLRY